MRPVACHRRRIRNDHGSYRPTSVTLNAVLAARDSHLFQQESIWNKLSISACGKDHVRSAPVIIVQQPPFVTCSRVVFSDKHLARVKGKRLSSFCRELQYPTQSEDVLGNWIVMPVEV